MVKLNESLLSHREISDEWERSNQSADTAKYLTLKQVERFEQILKDDESWEELLEIFSKGRDDDAWLALDWPDGFDELLLCVPLCRLVKFECSECTIGKRQDNNSCAHDFSVFGYIAELLKASDREGLIRHIDSVKKILLLDSFKWSISLKSIES